MSLYSAYNVFRIEMLVANFGNQDFDRHRGHATQINVSITRISDEKGTYLIRNHREFVRSRLDTLPSGIVLARQVHVFTIRHMRYVNRILCYIAR